MIDTTNLCNKCLANLRAGKVVEIMVQMTAPDTDVDSESEANALTSIETDFSSNQPAAS